MKVKWSHRAYVGLFEEPTDFDETEVQAAIQASLSDDNDK